MKTSSDVLVSDLYLGDLIIDLARRRAAAWKQDHSYSDRMAHYIAHHLYLLTPFNTRWVDEDGKTRLVDLLLLRVSGYCQAQAEALESRVTEAA
jgi:hypothetical protein